MQPYNHVTSHSCNHIRHRALGPALESETRPNATRLRSQGFGYLPGSLKEVSDLTVMLRKQGWNTTVFTDTEATEKQFRESIAGDAPEILHISTHGFHIPQPVTDSDSRNPFMVSDEPLMRSGLLFTGRIIPGTAAMYRHRTTTAY